MCLGTDTGGSIRVPASFCGITGLKPTYGRVSTEGVLPLSESLDHVGPLGSCVEDCALTMNAIAVEREEFNLEELKNFEGVRVGLPRNFFFEDVETQIAQSVHAAVRTMEQKGATVTDVDVPDIHQMNTAALTVLLTEAAALYAGEYRSQFSESFWELIETGKSIAGHDYVNALRSRDLFTREFAALWPSVDLLAVPPTPITAPPVKTAVVLIGTKSENVRAASTRLVRAMNFLGFPALSMPCGTAANGMPIGLQLIGPRFGDARLLQLAKVLERLQG